MTWWNELRLVCCAVLALAAIIAVVFAGILLFGKEGRQRRATRWAMKDLDRAARRPHRHDFTTWSEPEEVRVYATGTTASAATDALPVRRDYRQERRCRECGLLERRTA